MIIQETSFGSAIPAAPAAAPADEPAGPISMAQALAAAAAPDPQEMSPEQYRSYICGRISALTIHPSQSQCSISIHISDAGLQAMQQDPEYEAWVLDCLACDFSFQDAWGPLCGGSYVVHSFGASREEYHGESWFPGYSSGQGASLYEARSAGAAWRRDTPKSSSASSSDQYARLAAKLRLERMLRKIALERREFQSELLESACSRRALIEAQNRSGRRLALPSAPLPQLKGVSAAYLLAMLGTSI